MSIYIKVKKGYNAALIGSEILFSTKLDAVKNLIKYGVLEESTAHENTIIRHAVDKKHIVVEAIKGSIRKDRETKLKSHDTIVLLSPETAAWLRGEEYAPEETEETQEAEIEETETPEPIEEVAEVTENRAKKIRKAEPITVDVAELMAKHSASPDANNPAFEMMAKMFQPYLKPDYEFAAEAINKIVANAIKSIRPDKTEIWVNGEYKNTIGLTHNRFKDVLATLSTGEHVFMVGAAGSGKTTLAEQAAESLGMEFYAMSVGQQTTKSEIFGYMDAVSGYKPTLFRTAFECGGVFLFDEMDAGNAGVLTSINAALSNGRCGFPDGKMVKRSKDFICIAAANTYGRGADRQYVGRQPLDAATLDRFTAIDIDYDEELELRIAGSEEWTRKIQKMRERAFRKKVRMIISPRASIKGAKLLNAGFSEEQVLEMVVFKGCTEAEKNSVLVD